MNQIKAKQEELEALKAQIQSKADDLSAKQK